MTTCRRPPDRLFSAAPALVFVLALSPLAAATTPGNARPAPRALTLGPERLAKAALQDGRLVVPLDGGRRAELTLDPRLQRTAERVLKASHTPVAAAVLLSVTDGRVLAMAGRSTQEPQKSAAELCLTPWAPAASIFKLVTSAALLVQGIKPTARVCYHDGLRSVDASNLSAHPRLDGACNTLAFGLATSQNAIIARFVHEHLGSGALQAMARAFGFGDKLPGDLQAQPSTASIPSEALAFARVAAGFHQTFLSPLHAAWMAATIARGGVTPPLHAVSRVAGKRGSFEVVRAPAKRVLGEDVARALGRMMVGTTEFGTARRSFVDDKGRRVLPGVAVAGKTGTLARRGGSYLLYSWFVGYAPAAHPRVAVAVLLGNGADRYVRAHQVARDLLAGYFDTPAPRSLIASR